MLLWLTTSKTTRPITMGSKRHILRNVKKYRNAEHLAARYVPFTAAEEEQAEDDEAVVLDGIAAFTKMREELTVRTAAVGPSADGLAGTGAKKSPHHDRTIAGVEAFFISIDFIEKHGARQCSGSFWQSSVDSF